VGVIKGDNINRPSAYNILEKEPRTKNQEPKRKCKKGKKYKWIRFLI
jgi:hypothetical protein